MKKREASKKKFIPNINIKQIFGSKSTESLLAKSPTENPSATQQTQTKKATSKEKQERKKSKKQSLKIVLKNANLTGSQDMKSSLKNSHSAIKYSEGGN